jgi:SAM-dependent methyltransferase
MKEALDTRKQIARDWIDTQKNNLRTLQQIELEGIEKRAYEEKWRNEDLQSTLSKARQSHSRALIATLESERKAVAKGSSEELAIMKSLSEEKLKLARETGSLNMRTRAQDAEDAKKAREKAATEKAEVFLLQANAENLPFFSGTFDGLIMGGSLNEFGDPVKALYEARRVIKSDGRMFIMYLLRAETIIGSAMQKITGIGGINFWNKSESEQLFERTGFQIEKSLKLGIVHFCLLKPV